MEMMTTARKLGIWPRISHRRRAENQWADDLTEGKFDNFSGSRRWKPDLSDKFFYVLDFLDTLVRGTSV